MTDHQPMPVSGYTAQPDWKIQLVNKHKVLEEGILRHLDVVKGLESGIDQRWLAIGRTHLEQAFMAINRAVFQPQRLEGPLSSED